MKTTHARPPAGGRPSKATPAQLERLAAALGDWEHHATKAAAARAAGISLPTLMRWQQAHPWLENAWNDGSRQRYLLRQQAAKERAAARPRRPRPSRQIRLVCWYLLYRVHLGEPVLTTHVANACARVNLSEEAWWAGCKEFPDLLPSVARKRARRWTYAAEHGSIPMGWTPPDPDNYRTAAKAAGSFQQRRGTFLAYLFTHPRTHSPRREDPWL